MRDWIVNNISILKNIQNPKLAPKMAYSWNKESTYQLCSS